MSEITNPATNHNPPAGQSTATEPPDHEILYNYPEDFPIPENGFEPWDILSTLLHRARGISQFLVNECDDYHSDAAGAIYGILDQGIKITCLMERKNLERAIKEQEVRS